MRIDGPNFNVVFDCHRRDDGVRKRNRESLCIKSGKIASDTIPQRLWKWDIVKRP